MVGTGYVARLLSNSANRKDAERLHELIRTCEYFVALFAVQVLLSLHAFFMVCSGAHSDRDHWLRSRDRRRGGGQATSAVTRTACR